MLIAKMVALPLKVTVSYYVVALVLQENILYSLLLYTSDSVDTLYF